MIIAGPRRTVVRVLEKETKVGAILLTSDKKEYGVGEVVAVAKPSLVDVNPGDLVYFHRNSGLTFEHDDIPFLSLREEEILACSLKEASICP